MKRGKGWEGDDEWIWDENITEMIEEFDFFDQNGQIIEGYPDAEGYDVPDDEYTKVGHYESLTEEEQQWQLWRRIAYLEFMLGKGQESEMMQNLKKYKSVKASTLTRSLTKHVRKDKIRNIVVASMVKMLKEKGVVHSKIKLNITIRDELEETRKLSDRTLEAYYSYRKLLAIAKKRVTSKN